MHKRYLRRKPLAAAVGTVSMMVLLALAVIGPPTAVGQATRTWVSGVGDDVNPCSRTAPCKTFAGAISKTAAGGEISVLDPGGFGAVTITKSISIVADGSEGGILAAGTTGVIVNGANVVVNLRGLTIEGATTGVNGIRFLQGAALHISNSVIRGFATGGVGQQNGILVNNTSGLVKLDLTDTLIEDNGAGTEGAGIQLKPSGSGSVIASLTRVQLRNNRVGLLADGGPSTGAVNVNVIDSDATGSPGGGGFVADADSQIMLDSSNSSNNNIGISSTGAGAIVRLGRTTVTGNSTALSSSGGGVIESYSTNQIRGNGAAGSAPTPATQE
jgi:hypothetical protein